MYARPHARLLTLCASLLVALASIAYAMELRITIHVDDGIQDVLASMDALGHAVDRAVASVAILDEGGVLVPAPALWGFVEPSLVTYLRVGPGTWSTYSDLATPCSTAVTDHAARFAVPLRA